MMALEHDWRKIDPPPIGYIVAEVCADCGAHRETFSAGHGQTKRITTEPVK